MKFQYIVELTEIQAYFIAIEADSASEAIELAIHHQGEVEPPVCQPESRHLLFGIT